MAIQFQLHIPDPEDVAKFGGHPLIVGMDFRGMTGQQAQTAVQVFEKMIERLRQVAEGEVHDEEVRNGEGAPGAGGPGPWRAAAPPAPGAVGGQPERRPPYRLT